MRANRWALVALTCIMLLMFLPLTPRATASRATANAAPASVIPSEELPYGPYVDAIEYYLEPDEADMLEKLNTGERHLWIWAIMTPEGLRTADEMPNVDYFISYSGMDDLFVNPLPRVKIAGEDRFNPFGIREVREALNWLIDREYICKEVLGGLGYPQYTVFAPYAMVDYARAYPTMLQLETRYSYNPDKAKEVIFTKLKEAGCTFKDGKWYDPDGKLIEIHFFIRTEDERKDIGDYLASVIEEELGFTVVRDYGPGAEAFAKVYGGIEDWHLYTEGWGFEAIDAYSDWAPYYMYCSPWTGAVFKYYQPDPELVDLATKLLNAEYRTMEERLEWVKKLADLCSRDSTRIWMVLSISPWPYCSAQVENIAYDLVAGFYSPFTLRTARFKSDYGGPVGGTLKVGDFNMFVSAFNPVGGVKWVYEWVVWSAITDFGLWPHPHTGIYFPVRASFKVITAGPTGYLPVPEDALTFNATALDWTTVGPNVTATSAVTLNFVFGKWHHGEDMTMADIFAAMAHAFRVACEADPIYDAASITPGMEAFISAFRGIKVLNDTAVTVYIDYWHPDKTFIAAMADVWTSTPWEIYALMDDAVTARELAWSDVQATDWGVECLDLFKGPSLPILKSHYDSLSTANYIPPYMQDPDLPDCAKITTEMATARWSALGTWYDTYGHFLVSNGPFKAVKADTVAKVIRIEAFREYPFKADHWDWLVKPKVPDLSVEMPESIVMGEEATVSVTSTLEGAPYSKVDVTFMLADAAGRVVLQKVATWDPDAKKFIVTLTADETLSLTPGTYTAYVVAVPHEA
ncbi:hypothetical protein DRO33_01390, partial [Candidatus Bathyarchaeota archaeon]